MSLPRMSVDALLARFHVEPEILCVFTEGWNDRNIVDHWIGRSDLSATVYCIDEVEIPIDGRFAEYGGNKGRVFTLFECTQVSEVADALAVGVVDRDVDFDIGKNLSIRGVYYTEFACLQSEVVSGEHAKSILKVAFHKDLSKDQIEEIDNFSRFAFCIRAVKREKRPDASLPRFDKSIRSLRDGGFDYTGYVEKCNSSLSDVGDLSGVIAGLYADVDVRSQTHFHSTVEFLLRFLRKEKIIDSTVSVEELYRHFRRELDVLFSDTKIAEMLRAKVSALKPTS